MDQELHGQELQNHRLTQLESSIGQVLEKLDKLIDNKSDYRVKMSERIVRLEERQSNLQRIVYGAIGVLISVEIAGVFFVLDRASKSVP